MSEEKVVEPVEKKAEPEVKPDKVKKINPGWTAIVTKTTPVGDSLPQLVHAENKNVLRVMLRESEISNVLWIFKGKEVGFKENRRIDF